MISQGLGLWWPEDQWEAPTEPAPDPSAVERAIAYVKGRWADFQGLYPKILDLQHAAAVAANAAKGRGDLQTYQTAREAIQRLGDLAQLHEKALSDFRAVSQVVGLGAVPVAAAIAVVALAGLVAFIFARFSAETRVVQLLERGQLSPAEAAAILAQTDSGSPLQGFSDTLRWVALGFGAWALLNMAKAVR